MPGLSPSTGFGVGSRKLDIMPLAYPEPALATFVIDSSSPILPLMVGALAFCCALLGERAGRKRAMKRSAADRSGPSTGARLVVYIGVTVIFGILLLAPGGTSGGRFFFLVMVLPSAAWLISRDVRAERRKLGAQARKPPN